MKPTQRKKREKKEKGEFARKSVAFNKDNPRQKRLLEHALKQGNFSDYVKGLIQRDMEGGWSGPSAPTSQQEKFEEEPKIEFKDFADSAVDSFDAF